MVTIHDLFKQYDVDPRNYMFRRGLISVDIGDVIFDKVILDEELIIFDNEDSTITLRVDGGERSDARLYELINDKEVKVTRWMVSLDGEVDEWAIKVPREQVNM